MIDTNEYILLPRAERQKHINLELACLERGGNSTNHRGVLAQFLNTTIPGHKILLSHACNNAKCSNPHHLYWATHYENTVEDGKIFGHFGTIWERSVAKYGLEEASRRNARGNKSNGGSANRGKPKSEEHKRKISLALKNRARVAQLEEAGDLKSP